MRKCINCKYFSYVGNMTSSGIADEEIKCKKKDLKEEVVYMVNQSCFKRARREKRLWVASNRFNIGIS